MRACSVSLKFFTSFSWHNAHWSMPTYLAPGIIGGARITRSTVAQEMSRAANAAPPMAATVTAVEDRGLFNASPCVANLRRLPGNKRAAHNNLLPLRCRPCQNRRHRARSYRRKAFG